MFLLALTALSSAQDVPSITDAFTPPGIEPGSPTGSYALSGFETVHPYSGKLNFALPLMKVAGRGASGYTIHLRIARDWRFERSIDPNCNDSGCVHDDPQEAWTTFDAGFSPGMMERRATTDVDIGPCTTGGIYSAISVTRLTFNAPDGSQTELVDKNTYGKPIRKIFTDCSGAVASAPTRGTEFVSTDGSGMTFVSNTAIQDYWSQGGVDVSDLPLSGVLYFKDGTKYTINEDRVVQITDRNGNISTLTYTNPTYPRLVTGITDSLNRTVTISYSSNQDVITYNYGGASETVTINYAPLENRLTAGDQIRCYKIGAASSVTECQTGAQRLFDTNPNLDGEFNPSVVASVVLPNSQSYQFLYNSYGELASVTLPTGGVLEYTWGSGVVGSADGLVGGNEFEGADPMVIRRVITRLEEASSAGPSNERSYSFTPRTGIVACTADQIGLDVKEELKIDGVLDRETVFQYCGRPDSLSPFNGFGKLFSSPAWLDGREYANETKSLISGPPTFLRSSTKTWAQRPLAANEICWWVNDPTDGPSPAPSGALEPARDVQLIAETTTNDASQTSKVEFTYDRYNNISERREFDFAGADPVRRSAYVYSTDTNYVNPPAHLRSLITDHFVCGAGSGACSAAASHLARRRTLAYDTNTPVPLSAPSGHDSVNYPATYVTRGNLTSVTDFRGSTVSDQRTATYDIAGNMRSATLPGNRTTTFTYSQPLYASPTQIENALGHITQLTYNTLQQPTAITAPTQITTTFAYADPLHRLTEAVEASGTSSARKTTFEYQDAARKIFTRRDFQALNDQLLETIANYDGFGRTTLTQTLDDAGYIDTALEYDGLGRTKRTAAPRRSSESPLWTAATYDALDRPIRITHPDGSIYRNCYSGATTLMRDEAGKWTRHQADSLGRLIQVVEDPSGVSCDGQSNSTGLAYPSAYTYNANDNLLTVQQDTQQRSFSYDWLGQLLCASNPETRVGSTACPSSGALLTNGADRYSYDGNGNVTQRTYPDGTAVYSTYDKLNRVTHRTYSDGTPYVSFCYDKTKSADEETICETDAPTGSDLLVGKLTLVQTTSGLRTTYGSFDALGRVLSSSQKVDSADPYSFTFAYDLAGNLTSQTNPSARETRYTYTKLGQAKTAASYISGTLSQTYVSGATYAGHGGPTQFQLGNGVYSHTLYNSRLQPAGIQYSTSATPDFPGLSTGLLTLQFGYGAANNGNVLTQTIGGSSLQATQTYSYDPLNRLCGAVEASGTSAPTGITCGVAAWLGSNQWLQRFDFDRWGNRWVPQTHSANNALTVDLQTPTVGTNVSPSTNRLTGPGTYTYASGRGNLTAFGAKNFSYDGENRLREAQVGGVTTTYRYDGEGRRIQKSDGTDTTTYVYDAFGQLALEYSTSTPSQTGTHWLHTDHLGSTRLVTKANAEVVSRHDFLPFGEEINAGVGGRTTALFYAANPYANINPTQRFTSKERDEETGLDYFGARYFSGVQGRFTSADAPFADQQIPDPQSWNLYGYARNNPHKYVDPSGNAIETLWDIASIGIGLYSFVDNVSKGNYGDAALDAGGVVLDVGAAVVPLVPGGAGAAIKAARLANKVDDAADGVKAVRNADKAKDAATAAESGAKGGTYKLKDPESGEVRRTGQSKDLDRRKGEHARGEETKGLDFEVDRRSGSKAARRGREQRIYDQHPEADLNKRRPISPNNPRRDHYLQEGDKLK